MSPKRKGPTKVAASRFQRILNEMRGTTKPASKPERESKPRQPQHWLKLETGRDPIEWFRWIESTIGKHSTPPRTSGPYKGHSMTNVTAWLHDFVDELGRTRRRGTGDGNMQAAAVGAMILGYWFLRLQRAKAYDPRRPIVHRRVALERWRSYVLTLFSAAIDESGDGLLFPEQHFDPPFGTHAIDGHYV